MSTSVISHSTTPSIGRFSGRLRISAVSIVIVQVAVLAFFVGRAAVNAHPSGAAPSSIARPASASRGEVSPAATLSDLQQYWRLPKGFDGP
jgi:hypothetical protein